MPPKTLHSLQLFMLFTWYIERLIRGRRFPFGLRTSCRCRTIPWRSILHPRRRTEPTSTAHWRPRRAHALWSHSLGVIILWSTLHSIATSAFAHWRRSVHPPAHRTKP